jgi:hypothetical protein
MTEPGLFPHAHDHVSLDAQIAELKREQRMRDDVYPRWINSGTLKPSVAMRRQAALAAAIESLERLKHSTE